MTRGFIGDATGMMHLEVASYMKRRGREAFHGQETLLNLEHKEEWSDATHYQRTVSKARLDGPLVKWKVSLLMAVE